MLFFFLSLDFIASNTVLKNKNCYNFEKFYYDLKKNCVGKDKFKSSFPTVHQYRLKQAVDNQIIPNKIILFLDLTDVFDEGTSRWNLNGKNNKPSLPDDEIFKTNNKKKRVLKIKILN